MCGAVNPRGNEMHVRRDIEQVSGHGVRVGETIRRMAEAKLRATEAAPR